MRSPARYLRYLAPAALPWTFQLVLARLRNRRAHDFEAIRAAVEGKRGLEVGGPSALFRTNLLPLYRRVASLDNCVFSSSTVWHSANAEFRFDPAKPAGKQIICEGASLAVPDASYDFLLACHVLEHAANPLKMVREWRRTIVDAGAMVLLLPHRAGTSDNRRPYTTFEHLLHDLEDDVGEADMTHLEEILALHNRTRDLDCGTEEAFRARSLRNGENRCFHQHVFSPEVLVDVMTHARMRVHALAVERPAHIIVLATKSSDPAAVERNEGFKSPSAEWRRRAPFS